MHLRYQVAAALLLMLPLLGITCVGEETGPEVSLRLNAVPAAMSSLLVVPPSGFVVNVSFTPTRAPVVPETLQVLDYRWGTAGPFDLTSALQPLEGGAVGVIPPQLALAPGTHSLVAIVRDTLGVSSTAKIDFAVRTPPGVPPIGIGQIVWYDFKSDRDATPGPDFAVDLQAFGLGSAVAPTLSEQVEADVIAATLGRVSGAYYAADPNGLGLDPVFVAFVAESPGGLPDVTQICVGGDDPGGASIGSILIDPGNSNRSSIECATIPATGIFPRELLGYQGDAQFQIAFNDLRAQTGGVPVGEHLLDPIVLAAGFDPGAAPPDQVARYDLIQNAIDVFGRALGSILAHETGHALGLVPPGPPGGGLYGGSSGTNYAHGLTPAGAAPPENYLMKAGPTFTFSKLAGLAGEPLPFFSPLDFAYLRDRVILDSSITALLMPPRVFSVAPNQVTQSVAVVTIDGADFAAPPTVRCRNALYTYELIGETWVSSSQIRATLIKSQIPYGVYELEVRNPDGQTAILPAALTVY